MTVSEVRPGRDLKTAEVFVCPLGGRAADEVVAALNRAAAFLRGRLGRTVRLKFTPRIVFRADRSYDAAGAIGDLLARERVARATEAADDGA